MDTLIDSSDQGQEFLSEYLDLTDRLITGLSDGENFTDRMVRADVGY
jgi:hypothetical protein